jgi:hypothetical protein
MNPTTWRKTIKGETVSVNTEKDLLLELAIHTNTCIDCYKAEIYLMGRAAVNENGFDLKLRPVPALCSQGAELRRAWIQAVGSCDKPLERCTRCHGHGKIFHKYRGRYSDTVGELCANCNGSGRN